MPWVSKEIENDYLQCVHSSTNAFYSDINLQMLVYNIANKIYDITFMTNVGYENDSLLSICVLKTEM